MVPVYAVWLYAILSTLTNSHSVVVNIKGLVLANGPVPVGGTRKVSSGEIDFCFFFVLMIPSEDGGTSFPLMFMSGVQTTTCLPVVVFNENRNREEARDKAYLMARALGGVEVKELMDIDDDPVDTRVFLIWIAAGVVALVGCAWEVSYRLHWFQL